MKKIFIIGGKARHGKDTIASFIKEYYEEKDLKTIRLAFGNYIKMYAQIITSWDGSERTKPREVLQEIGTEVIRKKLKKEKMFVERVRDDIDVVFEFCDIVTIPDARFPLEIDGIKEKFPEAISILVQRENYESVLTSSQQQHVTEVALDNYAFDYKIINDSSLDELKKKVYELLDSLS